MDSSVTKPVSETTPLLSATKDVEKRDNLTATGTRPKIKKIPANPKACSSSSSDLTNSAVCEETGISNTSSAHSSDAVERSRETSVKSRHTSTRADDNGRRENVETENTPLISQESIPKKAGSCLGSKWFHFGIIIFAFIVISYGIQLHSMASDGEIDEVYETVGLSMCIISGLIATISSIYISARIAIENPGLDMNDYIITDIETYRNTLPLNGHEESYTQHTGTSTRNEQGNSSNTRVKSAGVGIQQNIAHRRSGDSGYSTATLSSIDESIAGAIGLSSSYETAASHLSSYESAEMPPDASGEGAQRI